MLKRTFAETEQPPPTASYAAFEEVIDAPIISFGETLGVIVCSREADRFDEAALRPDRGVREPRLGRPTERGDLRREHAAGASGARFYRIAAVLSEPLSAEATFDASPRRRPSRSARTRPPCSAATAATSASPAPTAWARR